jgi:hypothetical protein
MTLVVGQKIGSQFQIQSDSLITNRDATSPNEIPGRLKTIILNLRLCVSFAGLADAGIDAIRRLNIMSDSDFDIAEVITSLREAHEDCGQSVDFLVCSTGPHETLARISGGRVAQGANRYWIGDGAAVNEFQTRFDKAEPPQGAEPGLALLCRSLDAFASLLREGQVETVGGRLFRQVFLPPSGLVDPLMVVLHTQF